MKKDNRGFSLVELIISIAIIVIVLGMLGASLNYIGNSQARSLANAIKTAVGQARIQTMGKYDTYLYIYKSSGDNRYYKETWKRSRSNVGGSDELIRENRELLGKERPMVKYYVEGDTSEHEIDGTNGLLIKFDRTNGKEIEEDMGSGHTDEDGNNITTGIGTGTKSVLCNQIVIYYGTKEYNVRIVPATGKVSL
ncbi:MAG: prepilin-type N-terminal cleavage/methylation domain-containing protein [Lachnospiraceae bacterium]|nr:prepilin-type N-terminal cleavage/methylation domain-containing protein [Lachnospiraceae bacterium]